MFVYSLDVKQLAEPYNNRASGRGSAIFQRKETGVLNPGAQKKAHKWWII
jgi:hypothetical protein